MIQAVNTRSKWTGSVAWMVLSLSAIWSGPTARGDDVIFGYEGDVLPSDPESGLIIADACDFPCQESTAGGFLRVSFPPFPSGQFANYHRWISQPPQSPPPTLWVEWRFRSNHPLPSHSYSCDGGATARFRETLELVWLYGDAALSGGLDDYLLDLPLEEFLLLRFECKDGKTYRYAVNGRVFSVYTDNENYSDYSYVQFMTRGACGDDWIPNKYNEWDFVRYGTLGFGERIVATDPLMGFLDPNVYADADRFVITYDSPNFAHIDDFDVEVSCGNGPPCAQPPQVIATQRLDNGPANVLEVVLDRPLPPGERTTFVITDPYSPEAALTQTVAFTFQRGDIDADGDWDLRDFAPFQNCFGSPPCPAFDLVDDGEIIRINLDDFAALLNSWTGPHM